MSIKQEYKMLDEILKQVLKPDDLIKKYNHVSTERTTWQSKWQAINDQVFPNSGDFCGADKYQPQTDKIRNHSGIISGEINRIVSTLVAQTADPSIKWLNLTFPSKQLNDLKITRDWLHECCEILYHTFANPSSSFYPSTYSFIFDWFTLGTACREIVLRENGDIRFNCVPMQDIFVDISGYGDIRNIYRKFNLTSKQAFDLWGERLCPQMLNTLAQEINENSTRKYQFFEVVMPNPLKKEMPFFDYLSCVVDISNKYIVTYNTHAYSPYVLSRFFVTPGETYGRSNVWNVMPNMILINKLVKIMIHAMEFLVFPPMLVKDLQSLPRYPMTPGSFWQGIDSSGRATFQPLTMVGNISMLSEFLQQQINAFKNGLVIESTILPVGGSPITATETRARTMQFSNAVRPLIVMLESEDLNYTIKRTLKLLEQSDQLPPFPYNELQIPKKDLPDPIKELNITFSGQMAVMQKMQDIQNQEEFVQKIIQMAQISPDVMDVVNLDQVALEEAKTYNLSPKITNSEEIIQKIREERAKAQQKQQEEQQKLMNMEMGMRMAQTLGGKM